MRRGDLVTVALNGEDGKPRPALVIQTDLLAETDSVLVCLLTTTPHAAPLYRLSVPAGEQTGLHAAPQIMLDKIMAMRRDRCGDPVGRVDSETLLALRRLLALVLGVAD